MSTPTTPLLDLLDRPIAFHAPLARVAGGAAPGLFLSQAVYWQRRCPEGRGGWWWKSAAEWESETCLTRREQESARKKLREIGVLHERREGLPARLWFRIDMARLEDLLSVNFEKNLQFAQNVQTGMAESAKPDLRKAPDLICANRQDPKTTSETSTETTTPTPPSDSEPGPGPEQEGGGDCQSGSNHKLAEDTDTADYIRLAQRYFRYPDNVRDRESYLAAAIDRVVRNGVVRDRDISDLRSWRQQEQIRDDNRRRAEREAAEAKKEDEDRARAVQEAYKRFLDLPENERRDIERGAYESVPGIRPDSPGWPAAVAASMHRVESARKFREIREMMA